MLNAVGASTNAKKMRPPIQQTSEISMRNLRKVIREDYISPRSRYLDWHRHVIHDLFHHLIRLLRPLRCRGVLSVDGDAMREHGNRQRFEIFWSAEVAAVQERHGLGCTVERLRATRR